MCVFLLLENNCQENGNKVFGFQARGKRKSRAGINIGKFEVKKRKIIGEFLSVGVDVKLKESEEKRQRHYIRKRRKEVN